MDNPRSRAFNLLCARTLWVGILFSCAVPRVVNAACSLKPDDSNFQYSAAALEARDSFFASLCDESFAELVMFPDSRLQERLSPPLERRPPAGGRGFPNQARRLGLEGNPVVAYVVETDGVVDHVIIVQSSGHQLLDEAAVAYYRQWRFDKPGTLDGIPVRVLSTDQSVFKLRGPGARLPAAFTDEVIAQLGYRMIDYCNRGDADALYEGLDEAVKRKFSRPFIKQRLREYNGLYGEIALARYEGLLSAEIKDSVQVYEMAYALDLERPGAENVVLGVSVADRPDGPHVTDFWFRRTIVIHPQRRGGGNPPAR